MTRKQWDHYKATGEMNHRAIYWVVDLTHENLANTLIWGDDWMDHSYRDTNLICRTKRDAQDLAREMLAVARNRKETP